ncbi:MAG: lytic transglycosylase domain-containing protein [Treponema sp.]|nr:lytic transglycosylase domain-containing protein [Treponema sp.]
MKKSLLKQSLLSAVFLFFSLVSCAASPAKEDPPDPSVFYQALKAESRMDPVRAAELYEKALDSPSFRIRREAARKLGDLFPLLPEPEDQAKRILKWLEKIKKNEKKKPEQAREVSESSFVYLKASALYVTGGYEELAKLYAGKTLSPPETSLVILSRRESPRFEEARDFIYAPRDPSAGAAREQDESADRLLREFARRNFTVPEADFRVITGRSALTANNYDEALSWFLAALELDKALFFRYPGLLSDLGRAYQGVPSKRAEGLALFGEWETALGQDPAGLAGKNLSPVEQKNLRYILLFYSGRITRQQGKEQEASDFFARALDIAPDERQEDACIWYLLSSTMNSRPENAAALVKRYAPRWHRSAGFSDILDRLCCYLVGLRKWTDLAEILPLIEGAPAAQYAYILGRAAAEGYVSIRGKTPEDFFTTAYEEGNGSFYYRALAASYLGKSVVPLRSGENTPLQDADTTMLDFYRGFFDYGAVEFLPGYIRNDREDLSVPVLRALAGLLADQGHYLDSINLTRAYMNRENYLMERADLELYYPRAFSSLIEANARETGIEVPVFFGLVRTESAFMPAIVSRAGAVGLAQLMPATAREVNAMVKRRNGRDFSENGGIDLGNPETNVYLGAVYLSSLTDSLESPMLALLAYNGGPSRIRRLRRAAPSLPVDLFLETVSTTETREYGKRVMAAAAAYGYLYYGMSMEEVVADIFK